MPNLKIFFISLLILVSSNIIAKPFVNNFIEFNLPDDWNCLPFQGGPDWSCQPMNPEVKNEAIIVILMRGQKKIDNLTNYITYFNKPLTMAYIQNGKAKSKPTYSKFKEIAGQQWVDSQHESSEIPNYLTRYIATIQDGRVILIAITVYKEKYNTYMHLLYALVESIKLRNQMPEGQMMTGVEGLINKVNTINLNANKPKEKKLVQITVPQKSKFDIYQIIGAVSVFLIIIVLLIIKKRKSGKKTKGLLRR